MTKPQRRRIDIISDPVYLADIADLENNEVRDRRAMCAELDRELSYYRRLLHGRLDLLRFERRRRAGEETRSLFDALPDILSDERSGERRHVTSDAAQVAAPEFQGVGNRTIDYVLGDAFLSRIAELSDAELDETEAMMMEAEELVSRQRRTAQEAHDALGEELSRRYRQGLTSVDELFQI